MIDRPRYYCHYLSSIFVCFERRHQSATARRTVAIFPVRIEGDQCTYMFFYIFTTNCGRRIVVCFFLKKKKRSLRVLEIFTTTRIFSNHFDKCPTSFRDTFLKCVIFSLHCRSISDIKHVFPRKFVHSLWFLQTNIYKINTLNCTVLDFIQWKCKTFLLRDRPVIIYVNTKTPTQNCSQVLNCLKCYYFYATQHMQIINANYISIRKEYIFSFYLVGNQNRGIPRTSIFTLSSST